VTDRTGRAGDPRWTAPPAGRAWPSGIGAARSPWWSDALNDPWRDAQSPAVLVHAAPPPPEPAAPAVSAQPPRALAIFALVLVTALLAGGLGGALGYAAAVSQLPRAGVVLGTPARSPAAGSVRPPGSLAQVAARVLPGVVTVHATASRAESVGSGFVISADGYVLTNDHVVAGMADESISVTFADTRTARASIAGRDPESDLAVLKVDRPGLSPVQLGDSDAVAVGDPVFAVGSPFALSGTVTAGIVSALDRTIETDDASPRYYAAIQTDTAINPGNSGGPLFDLSGTVIGVNSVINSVSGANAEPANIGIAFAIPINQAKRIAAEIIDTGRARRTVIGAELEPAGGIVGTGARIRAIDLGGPAEQAGLRPGDLIVSLASHPIESPSDVIALVRRYDPGTAITVEYQRGAATQQARVTLVADAN
jgi:putative serine protease PepD